jgi:hypothetical protein
MSADQVIALESSIQPYHLTMIQQAVVMMQVVILTLLITGITAPKEGTYAFRVKYYY